MTTQLANTAVPASRLEGGTEHKPREKPADTLETKSRVPFTCHKWGFLPGVGQLLPD